MPEEAPQYPNALARLLAETKSNYGYSATELARRIGCHRSHLYRFLKGECLPENAEYLQGIARVCHRDLAFIQQIVQEISSPASSSPRIPDPAKEIRKSLAQIQGPAELFASLPALAKDAFQAEQVEVFLGGLAEPLPYLWCVNSYLVVAPQRSDASIPLYRYVREWGTFTPQSIEDIIVRAFAAQQIQEYSDPHFLRRLGVKTAWLLVAPLVSRERSIGCLVFQSSARAYLTPPESAALKDICHWVTEGLMEHPLVFDRMCVYHAARMMIDSYRNLGGEEISTEAPTYLAALSEQATVIGRTLLAAGNQLRRARFRFHDVSIQQIDEESGTMLAIGTRQKGKGLLPPALFDATTAVPCWEAFKSKKPVYRPDLHQDDPYSEKDYFTQQPVLSIIDLPFSWGGYRGTLGINSLDARPWADSDLAFLEEFVKRFRLAKG
jgi:GAF domain-containing protein